MTPKSGSRVSILTLFAFLHFFPVYAIQLEKVDSDSIQLTTSVSLDSVKDNFSLGLDEFLTLQDHNTATWISQFPHTWISKSAQPGHPQQVQMLGSPAWISEIRWREMSMNDPVYGLFDLYFLPRITMENLQSQFNGFDQPLIEPQIREPYSQVYYRQGQDGESEVDVLFQRGIGKTGYFQLGGAFNKFDGRLDNSKVDDQKIRIGYFFPVRQRYFVTYQLLTNNNKAEYSGDFYEDSSVQFNNLKRKIRRIDHILSIDLPSSQSWKKSLVFEYHRDRRDYTDNTDSVAINTEDVIRWGRVSGLLSYRSKKSVSKASFHIRGASASSLGFGRFQEFPIGVTLTNSRELKKSIFAELNLDYSYHDSNWQAHKIRFGLIKIVNPYSRMSLILYDQGKTPPLGWRKGKLLPFENQPWPLLFSTIDTTFKLTNKPQKSVSTRGIRIQYLWNNQNKIRLFGDLVYQSTNNYVFPYTLPDSTSQLAASTNFNSLGLFIRMKTTLNSWFHILGKYQYSYHSQNALPEFEEIPNQNLRLQFHLSKILFNGNLDGHLFLTGEYFDKRISYGFAKDSVRIEKYPLDRIFLFHAKVILHIGDARIFFQWQNLLGQEYAFRIFRSQPRTQFQYGVIWNFRN